MHYISERAIVEETCIKSAETKSFFKFRNRFKMSKFWIKKDLSFKKNFWVINKQKFRSFEVSEALWNKEFVQFHWRRRQYAYIHNLHPMQSLSVLVSLYLWFCVPLYLCISLCLSVVFCLWFFICLYGCLSLSLSVSGCVSSIRMSQCHTFWNIFASWYLFVLIKPTDH